MSTMYHHINGIKLKVMVHTLDIIAPLRSESPPQKLRYGISTSQGILSVYMHTHTFIRNRNEPYRPLMSSRRRWMSRY